MIRWNCFCLRLSRKSSVHSRFDFAPCKNLFLRALPLGEPRRSRYDVEMAQRPRFVLAILPFLLFALLCGCKPRPKSSTVVVHLLRDLRSVYGSELDRRILDFQGSNPRIGSGAPIVIESETGDYKDMLQRQSPSSENIDLIILNSAEDAISNATLQAALPQATNICAGLKACPATIPAIIPQQVSGNEREAAQKFLNFLQKTPGS